MSSEVWKDVVGYEGFYQVSNVGRVRSLDRYVNGPLVPRFARGRMLIPHCEKPTGYLTVNLKRNSKTYKKARIHRLLMEAFVGECPPGQITRHIDDNPERNLLDNLCYGTYTDNQIDRINNSGAGKRLTKSEAVEIVKMLDSGMTHASIACHFGVSRETISDINNGRTWGWLTGRRTARQSARR